MSSLDFTKNPIVKKKVKGEKIKVPKSTKPPKKDIPIKMNKPDCDKPKESGKQLRKNIKRKDVNGGKGNGSESE